MYFWQHTNTLDLTRLSIEKAADFFIELHLTEQEKEISKVIIKEIETRLQFLLNVGLEYLSLDRKANTLSGGEAQRICSGEPAWLSPCRCALCA